MIKRCYMIIKESMVVTMKNDTLEQEFKYTNGTLRNKLGITQSDFLSSVEFNTVSQRIKAIELNPNKFKVNSISDFKLMHRFLFGRIYSWAGQDRHEHRPPYDLSKNGHQFQPWSSMDMAEKWINRELADTNAKVKPLATDYANLLIDINELHPFREGNGRTTKIFLQTIAGQHKQELCFPHYQGRLVEAMNNVDFEEVSRIIKIVNG